MKFTKPPLTIQEQLNHIQNQYKIKFQNEELAKNYLLHCNYYKLRGYWLFFEEIEKEAYFEEIINLYEFDKSLKNLLLNYIERIESSIKSIFAYYLSTTYKDPHILLNKTIFENQNFYKQSLIQLINNYYNSNELFAYHFQDKYDEIIPPIWVSVELMTLGEISKWYRNLNIDDRKKIAKYYYLKERYLSTFLLHLTEVRNICAHNGRLWNKKISKGFQIPSFIDLYAPKQIYKVYHTIVMMDYILTQINIENSLLEKVIELILKHNIPIKYMGFPTNHNIKGLEDARYEY